MRIAVDSCSLAPRHRLLPRLARIFPALLLPVCGFALLLTVAQAPAQSKAGKPLLIYSIDVEGGQATLLVAPSGASLLVDAGWPTDDSRDA